MNIGRKSRMILAGGLIALGLAAVTALAFAFGAAGTDGTDNTGGNGWCTDTTADRGLYFEVRQVHPETGQDERYILFKQDREWVIREGRFLSHELRLHSPVCTEAEVDKYLRNEATN